MTLKYVGSGFLPGIPARDLTEEEINGLTIQEFGGSKALVASGLYEEVKPIAAEKKVDKSQKEGE